jgi:MFS family permease
MSLISRIVGITDLLNITSSDGNAKFTALLYLLPAVGDIISSLVAGSVLMHGSLRKAAVIFAMIAIVSLSFVGISVVGGNLFLTATFFFCTGLGFGGLNISMNMLAASVERYRGIVLMPRFHGFYNVGAVAGASASEIVVLLKIPISIQYFFVTLSVTVIMFSIYRFLFDREIGKEKNADTEKEKVPLRKMISSVDKLTLLVGLVIICSELIEGSGNNWVMKALEETFHIEEHKAIPFLWISLASATLMRFFGSNLASRIGKYNALIFSFVLAGVGVAIICFEPTYHLSYIAAVFWGGGISLSYPLAISFVTSAKENAPFKTSVVSAVGGVLNILFPPLIGFAGAAVGIRNALMLCLIAMLGGVLVVKFGLSKIGSDGN